MGLDTVRLPALQFGAQGGFGAARLKA